MYGQPNYYNQFYGQPMQQMPKYQQQYQQPVYQPQTQNVIQGKSVDSIDVVKAMDIPLDGSISYFPITDGTAIVTKQLQQDGTSKTIIYKPVENQEIEVPKYITKEDFNNYIKNNDNTPFKDEIKTIKRQLKELTVDIEELKERKD